MDLRIITYNIHGLPWCGINVAAIADWLFQKTSSEIICLQEVFSKQHRKVFQEKAATEGWKSYFPDDDCSLGHYLRGIECGSGLGILVHPSIDIVKSPSFSIFHWSGGVDSLVTKGYFLLHCKKGQQKFCIVNTHMQSDLTDIPYIRVNYPRERNLQEMEMYAKLIHEKPPIIAVGDMNQATFKWFERIDPVHHITFAETGEHLDHALILKRDATKIKHVRTIYYDKNTLSDHIAVQFIVTLNSLSS